MKNPSPYDHLPAGYDEDRPFRMSDPVHVGLTEIQDSVDSLPLIARESERIPFPRNTFFGGLCLALPLSALLWLLVIYVL